MLKIMVPKSLGLTTFIFCRTFWINLIYSSCTSKDPLNTSNNPGRHLKVFSLSNDWAVLGFP